MRFIPRASWVAKGLICIMPLALLAGAWLIARLTVDHLLDHDAVMSGQNWANYLVENVKDLDRIAAGQKPSEDSQRFFDRAQKVGQVFRYVIYDPKGHLRLVSDNLDDDGDEDEDLGTHNPAAVRAIDEGRTVVNAEDGKPPTRPPFFAEAYVPVVVGGKTVVAVVEVYVDQTEKRNAFRQTFVVTSAALLALVALAFGVPGLAWRRRSAEKRRADAHIHFLAHHDALTGLINRHRLAEDAAGLLGDVAPSRGGLALHYIDIDRFKDINDTFGHAAGDALLVSVAERLSALAGAGDRVARVGGDEFVVLQTAVTDTEVATRLGQAIVRELARPVPAMEHTLAISASVGVAVAPHHGETFARLTKSADLALYRSKGGGRNAMTLFSPDMDNELAERLRLEQALRAALLHDRFELYFQPVVAMPARRLVGFEALIRMHDEAGTLVPPAAFIPLAEQMGLIDRIGRWVLEQGCRAATTWPRDLKVAVNLSPAQLASGDLSQTVATVLAETGLDPRRLELEITEGMLLDNSEAVMAERRKLKALQVGIVMDDFGTGYSSLSYLWKFPFDKIKIDRAFMLALDTDARGEASTIVRTIIGLGRSLNVTVTVEGVETDRQVEFVDAAHCDQIQGYYFGRPIPSGDVAAHIQDALPARVDRALARLRARAA